MDAEILMLLERCPLFRGCEAAKAEVLLKACRAERKRFMAAEEIPLEENGKGRIGILLSGQLTVLSPGEDKTPLNRLEPGGTFGVSALFGSPGAGTRILAKTEGELLFITEENAEVLWEEKEIRRNLISFLTDRICFLNRKIASFTASGAEGKLARFLSQCADEKGLCRIDTSYSQLAKSLHLGRASLYRAMARLEEEGIISKEKKAIRILSPESIALFW